MRIFIATLFLFSFGVFASDKLHLELINGSWNCPETSQEEEVTIKVTTKYSYDTSNLTYTYHSKAEMLYQNKVPVGTVQVIEKGTFSYKSSKMVYELLSIESDVLDDPLEAMTDELIKEMEADLKSDKTAYQTTFINKLEWETLDPTDNSKTVCTRDIIK